MATVPEHQRRRARSDRLLGSAVWSAHHRKVLVRTWACLRVVGQGLSPRASALHPGATLEDRKRHIWTREGPLRAGRPENSSTQVPMQRSQPGGAAQKGAIECVCTSQQSGVKEAGRDFTYLIVVVIGIGVTGGLFYVIFKELFSSSSPSKIYGDALEKCRAHPEVIGVFGEPIKGYGEATRRGRRQHVSNIEYVKDGLKYMRLKFYIEGSEKGKQGTVHVEVKENPASGKYEYRYVFVDIDVYPRRTIIIEDNR